MAAAIILKFKNLVPRAMDYGLVSTLTVSFGLGWLTRFCLEPQPLEKPCACSCICQCLSSSGPGFWLLGGLVLVLLGMVAFLGYHLVFAKNSVPAVGSPKGRKGVYGVSGKVLSLTG